MSESGTASAIEPPTRASSAPSTRHLPVGRPGTPAVREDATPVRLGAVVQRVPVPVLDHPGAARDQRPRGLTPLARVRRAVGAGPPMACALVSVTRNGSAAAGEHRVARLEQRPGPARSSSTAERPSVARVSEPVLHAVVGVPAGDVQDGSEVRVLEGRALVGDAGGDELVGPCDLADGLGLPVDHLRGQRTPGTGATPGRTAAARCRPASTGPPRWTAGATSRRGPTPGSASRRRRTCAAGGRRTARTPRGCAAGAGPARCPPGTRPPPGGPGSAPRSWRGSRSAWNRKAGCVKSAS